MENGLTLAQAVEHALRDCGVEALYRPKLLLSFLLDDMSDGAPELRVLERNIDETLLRPYANAVRGNPFDVAPAVVHAKYYLTHECMVEPRVAHSIAEGLAGGVASWMGVSYVPHEFAQREPEVRVAGVEESQADFPLLNANPMSHGGLDRRARESWFSDFRKMRWLILGAVCASVLAMFMGIGLALLNHGSANSLKDSDPFYVLLLGVDAEDARLGEAGEGAKEPTGAFRSDSIMLCRIDPRNAKVTVVSIHRDTLVNLDEYGPQKINAAYAYGGAEYAVRVVSEFAGVPISHYVEIRMDELPDVIDSVGGITVDLDMPIHDPDFTKLDLPVGTQSLDGVEATMLCRCSHAYDQLGDGDVFRAANQRMVLRELIRRLLAQKDPASLIRMIAASNKVTTDLSIEEIGDLIACLGRMDVDSDIMESMEPTEGVYIKNAGWYEECKVDEWNAMMNRVNRGLPPESEE